MYIERHNRAGRRVVKEISKGKHGANFTMGDLGAYDKVEHLGRENRIPKTILSDRIIESMGCQTGIREKLRPDIMVVEVSPAEVESGITSRHQNGAVDTTSTRAAKRSRRRLDDNGQLTSVIATKTRGRRARLLGVQTTSNLACVDINSDPWMIRPLD